MFPVEFKVWFSDLLLNPGHILGQQQHYFDSRLTYHASRSAMGVGMGAAGYPGLANTWGYQTSYPASAYLGYNSSYSSSLAAGYSSSVIDPGALITPSAGTVPGTQASGALGSDTASPAGKYFSNYLHFCVNCEWAAVYYSL